MSQSYKVDTCIFCGEKFTYAGARDKKVKGKKGLEHHLSYKDDTTVPCCLSCHNRLHGQQATHNHAFKKKYAKDIEPFMWAKRVVEVYYKHLIEPKEINNIILQLLLNPSKDITEH